MTTGTDKSTDTDGDEPPRPDPVTRRGILETRANPQTALDYLVAIDATAASPGRTIHLRYVPDKLLLRPDSFGTYLTMLTGSSDTPPEEHAITIIEDINNEVVPRWVQVQVRSTPEDRRAAVNGYRVVVEDRQPNWDNPNIIPRSSDSRA